MLKRIFAAVVCLCLLYSAARADSLPIYFQKSEGNNAPYEKVEYLAEASLFTHPTRIAGTSSLHSFLLRRRKRVPFL